MELKKEYLELYSAVGAGNAELVEALITKGLDVNQDYAVSCIRIRRKMRTLYLFTLEQEISGAVGPNTSRFLLFEAVVHEHKEVVDTLLRHGSKVDIPDNVRSSLSFY